MPTVAGAGASGYAGQQTLDRVLGTPDSSSTCSDPTRSLLVLTAGDDFLRLAPPLTFDDADVTSALAIRGSAFDATHDSESRAAI